LIDTWAQLAAQPAMRARPLRQFVTRVALRRLPSQIFSTFEHASGFDSNFKSFVMKLFRHFRLQFSHLSDFRRFKLFSPTANPDWGKEASFLPFTQSEDKGYSIIRKHVCSSLLRFFEWTKSDR
jgi:hypothetical protein